ncbi:60S ribosomal protein L17-2-like protein [Tanacetum coccineum]
MILSRPSSAESATISCWFWWFQVVPVRACKARGSDLRCHFKNTRETAHALRKMPLIKAKRNLEDVLAHKQAIPFTRSCRGVGRLLITRPPSADHMILGRLARQICGNYHGVIGFAKAKGEAIPSAS